MTEILQIKRPDSLSKTAEEHIRNGIINGTFQLGESLPEVKLSNAMGISKTPIREALSALNLQGLVQIFPHRGAFVFSLSQEDVVQLCQYRLILESAALEQALEKNPTVLINELATIVSKMSEAQEADEFEQYLELDAEFHHAFFKYCENSYLRDGYQKVGDIVQTMRTHLSKRSDRTKKSFQEHQTITALLSVGKVKAAKNTLKRQITRGERSYSDLVGVEQR
ncbi:GntR family transcriptional regulator [Ruegeria meonggei]|uniref:HTH-type transcriptional repressor CsiR n=1 Tax=Ruegeria meonggei TaxID=1446476 RepID=A0A1X7A054_9RHOB|nr:GntR family transcriptional regulator [Ruegeria meonggei]SLN66798.1 HTH-type transcriptional repressor CsiR [Ruegeria meonggei]